MTNKIPSSWYDRYSQQATQFGKQSIQLYCIIVKSDPAHSRNKIQGKGRIWTPPDCQRMLILRFFLIYEGRPHCSMYSAKYSGLVDPSVDYEVVFWADDHCFVIAIDIVRAFRIYYFFGYVCEF